MFSARVSAVENVGLRCEKHTKQENIFRFMQENLPIIVFKTYPFLQATPHLLQLKEKNKTVKKSFSLLSTRNFRRLLSSLGKIL